MSMDKELYKQKIHQLVEKIKKREDKELIDYLISEITGDLMHSSKIDYIYEYCIESIIKQQAKDFYSKFPLQEIIPNLMSDFIRMEKFRRQNNFEDFCIALYQQIECITNKICSNSLLAMSVEKMWSCGAYIKSWDPIANKPIEPSLSNRSTDNFSIAKLVLIDTPQDSYQSKSLRTLQGQYAIDKIRIVVYYLGYQALMKNSDYESYRDVTSTLNDIYQCRNLNHRGNPVTEKSQQIIDRVLSQKSYHYLKFMGVLTQYVSYIQNNLSYLKEIYDYAKTITPKKIIEQPKIVGKIELSKTDTNKKRFKN